ncbi:uncharacterized protein LOC131940509 [Physella acuta]|uniref:uncharacterized protein LOC131940509 n=1 Tax=Physella acuta TaxID=109671 RepID=UPI0027DD13C6|nr:uncharacterized protein LOC131940509 [Physella acuta]
MSTQGDCMELRCTVGKLMDNRTCTAAFPFIRGLTYNFQLWLVADPDDNDEFFKLKDYFTLEQLLRSIDKKMDSLLVSSGVEYFANTAVMKTRIGLVENFYFTSTFIFSAHYTLVGNFSLPRDSAEDQILETLLFSSITVPIIDTVSVKMRAVSGFGGFVPCSRFASGGMVQCLDATRGNISEKFYSGRAISLKNTLKCRFVSFNKSDYSVEMNDTEIPPSVTVLVRLKVVNLTFTESSELNSIELNQHGELNVCNELLDKKLKEWKRNKNLHHKGTNLMRRAGYILTLTCASASMVCLLLTLMTYIRFPVLRNTAGKNTMFLCASLFLAQAMLLTSSHLSAPSLICTASGISTHFLWLWMLSWSFTCSYHMFQIFTSKAPTCARPRSAGPQMYKNIIRSLILPSVAVAGVIVFSSVYTSGLSYGYGNFACYIDAPMMNALTFVGPLTTITFSNIAFFLITVFKIQSIVKLQTTETFKKDDRHHVYVYIKLSLMTGGFWTLAILAEIVDNDVLRIVSILLNGLQGVVLFVSYSCNRRVYNMYISSRGDHSTSTTASVVARNVKLRLAYPE